MSVTLSVSIALLLCQLFCVSAQPDGYSYGYHKANLADCGFPGQNEPYCEEQVKDAFESSQLVPDIMDKAPPGFCVVSYGYGKFVRRNLYLGKEFTPLEVKFPPAVSWIADENKYYTLVYLDYDFPSRTDHEAEFWHWLVVNIPGNYVTRGQVLYEYVGSAPYNNTGHHRYTFIVLEQTGYQDFSSEIKIPVDTIKGRTGQTLRNWISKYYSYPVAGNFYEAAYDDSVPCQFACLVNWPA